MLRRLSGPAADDDLTRRCARVLDARLDAASAAPVAVALSGGGDSLALLHLAAAWTRACGRPLLALTVDHRLHPDSPCWTHAAGRMAGAVGAAWRSLAWDDSKPAAGLPAAARRARHRLLAQAARDAGARVLLLAHTADDVAEGELMRAGDSPGLGRLREWGPSPVWPQGRGIALLRPLLAVGRAELRAWLAARGLAWLEDPANADLSHPRIRARRLGVTAARLPVAPLRSPPLFEAGADGEVRASRAALTAAPPAEARVQLAAALACAGGRGAPVRGRVAAALVTALAEEGALRRNAGGALLVADGDAVTLTAEPPRRGTPPPSTEGLKARLDLALGRVAREADLA